MPDQKKQGCRSTLGECVAHVGRGECAHVEFDDGAAVRCEAVPQNTGPGRPVDTRLGGDGDSTVARAAEEVRVDRPAVRLRRGEPRDPWRGPLGQRVEHTASDEFA